MSPLVTGVLIGIVTVVVLLSGVPVAVGLGVVAMSFLLIFEGPSSLTLMAELFFGKLDDFTLLAIPMFIVMGAAIAASQAGADLYDALDRWLYKIPGGLVISNLAGCALFSALSGSSPATCAAIGKMGIPAMRERGFSDSLAAGAIAAGGTLGILIPPSITMIVYGIATETSIGRLFLAGVIPGLMLTTLFMMWAIFATWRFGSAAVRERNVSYSWKERFQALPKVLPFLAIILAVVFVLYGGVATPSETAGVGAFLVILLVMVIYRVWQPAALWKIMKDSTRESVMILFIIAASGLFSFMLSSLYVTQSLAELIVSLDAGRWVLMFFINMFLLVSGFFLPPVAVILMAAPILLPIITEAGFDPYWFAVVLTVNMEIGLITPPVGLNLYVINSIVPDIGLPQVLKGALPFMLCMVLGIILLCIFPQLATWLPNALMGVSQP
ncbi:MAG: TRAP transporter large permease [Acidobacteria bacterium]|nr:MAG: TRAP transporter large permease [Acidobacteriota bacterium]